MSNDPLKRDDSSNTPPPLPPQEFRANQPKRSANLPMILLVVIGVALAFFIQQSGAIDQAFDDLMAQIFGRNLLPY
ncbi:MAG: hypothetical protein JJ908_05875 [Rhizobiales bacterium]|nr:hypothetical protein [Hyphomicrobiales bacterium]MBO6697866.1 hypothetical protein [Hyphomicrobiales bacterium]MBO6735880.1 hypothetical protein [Hyphomicrobiales bacterium]MBO6913891.1 hypothetical protein [Hyphomicrobiales bacterium]MBO6955594.1 hypothetical protein [Hyphomicrobiales bacterium]